MDDEAVREQVAMTESLLADLETLPHPVAREAAGAAVQSLLALYGEALARIMGHIGDAGADAAAEACLRDELVSHLLLLHELHPHGDQIEPDTATATSTAAGTGGEAPAFIPLASVGRRRDRGPVR